MSYQIDIKKDGDVVATILISEAQEKCLLHDLLDIPEWISGMFAGKINNCGKRMYRDWHPKLLADPTVDTFPANEADLVTLITDRPDYKNRKQRDEEEEAERRAEADAVAKARISANVK